MYEVTPDHNALLGESTAASRFLYATGFSGHGFLQGPAVGEVIRDLYLGIEPFLDVSPVHRRPIRLWRAARRGEHRVMQDRIWAAMHELAATAGSDAGHRAAGRVGVVTVSDMGVPHAWGVNAVVGPAVPPAADLSEAIDWLRDHDRRGRLAGVGAAADPGAGGGDGRAGGGRLAAVVRHASRAGGRARPGLGRGYATSPRRRASRRSWPPTEAGCPTTTWPDSS